MTALLLLLLILANRSVISVIGSLEDDSTIRDMFPEMDDFPTNFDQFSPMKIPPFILRMYERQKSKNNFGIIRALRNELSEPFVESGCVRKMPMSFNLSSVNNLESVVRAEIHVQLPKSMHELNGNWTARKKRLMFRISNGSSNGRLPLRASMKSLEHLIFNVRNELIHIRQRNAMVLEIQATNFTCWPQNEPVEVQLVIKSRRKEDRVGKKRKRFAAGNKNKKHYGNALFNTQFRQGWNRCHKKELVVNFHTIGWKWVIEPRRYQAFACQGFCKFPLSDHMNTTNHATVQAMMHSVNPRQVAPPCCVPTSLAPISMLYYDSSNNIVMRQYDNMVVLGCGCR